MKMILALLTLLVVAGCATQQTAQEQVTKDKLVASAITSAQASLFELTCPAEGCIIGSLKVGNPSAAASMAETIRVVMTPQQSTSERVALAIVDKGFTALGIGLVANGVKSFANSMFSSQTSIATGGFNALQNTAAQGFASNSATARLIQAPAVPAPNVTTTTNTTNTTTLSGSGVIGSGSYNAPVTTTTTTNTNSNNTNPAPRVCTPTYGTAGQPTGFTCTGG